MKTNKEIKNKKISEARLRRKARLGYVNSPKARRKMSEARKGKKQ